MVSSILKAVSFAGFATAAMLAVTSPSIAQSGSKRLEVVAGMSSSYWYQNFEKQYFEETLPKISGGKLTTKAVPFNELGLSGFEVLRLMKIGTYDIISGVLGTAVQTSPVAEGADLAGTIHELEPFRKAVDAYRPIIDREFQAKYNAKLLAIYPWPQTQIFCNLGDKQLKNVSLETLKGKKIRSFSSTVSDFIEGLGAVPVTVAFAEVIPSLQRGVLDCAITSSSGAYTGKLYQVTTHNFSISAGFASNFIAVNVDTWKGLNKESQDLLTTSMAELEGRMWESAQRHGEETRACLRSGPCPLGEAAGLVHVEPTKEEWAQLNQMAERVVLKRWASRCGTQKCLDDWNATIGKVTGLSVSK